MPGHIMVKLLKDKTKIKFLKQTNRKTKTFNRDKDVYNAKSIYQEDKEFKNI